MSSFIEQLKKTSDENTEELREKREQEMLARKREAILEQLFENIKESCMRAAEDGRKDVYCKIRNELFKIVDEDNEQLFFQSMGAGYKPSSDEKIRKRQVVFCRPKELKNYIETALVKEGFEDFEITEEKIPLYEIVEKVKENSTGAKVLSGTMNLLLGTNYDTDITTKKYRKQIGTQVVDFKLHIQWE